jgi:serine/threonine-protein kinase
MRERMDVEARAMAQLDNHPAMVRVVDYGRTADDRPFLVMDYLDGVTLEADIAGRRIAPRLAVEIVIQLLSGLAEAHRHSIVHRDIKPANVMLARQEGAAAQVRVKIVDFGIAKVLGAQRNMPTKTGSILGSPHYMAPEQAAGDVHGIDGRADLYAAGCMLYRMLTGDAPFHDPGRQQTLLEILQAHATMAPQPLAVRTGLPFAAELEGVVAKALAKSPAHRFQTAKEFADALSALPPRALEDPADAPKAGLRGTLPIDRRAMAEEAARLQREKERQQAAVGKRGTMKIPADARRQELSRRFAEQWPAPPQAAPIDPTALLSPPIPSPPVVVRPQLTSGDVRPAPPLRRGFTRREAVAIAIVCGLVVAASVIALLAKFRS